MNINEARHGKLARLETLGKQKMGLLQICWVYIHPLSTAEEAWKPLKMMAKDAIRRFIFGKGKQKNSLGNAQYLAGKTKITPKKKRIPVIGNST